MEIQRIGVFGAGSIGVGWAIVFGCARLNVILYDPANDRRQAARPEIEDRLSELHEFGLIRESPSAIADRIAISEDERQTLAAADYVQECAPEDLSLKRHLFRKFDKECRPSAI